MALFVEAGYELGDTAIGGYTLDVVETGGATFTVSIATGTYFLTTDASTATGDHAARVTGYTSLIAKIETDLNAGAGGGATDPYTVTFSTTTKRVTITHDGGGTVTAVQLTATNAGGLIGQTATKSGALSHEMDRTPDYFIAGAIGFFSNIVEEESDDDRGEIVIAEDGTPFGKARKVVPNHFDVTFPLEPRAIVRTSYATSDDPWTWQKLFRHARNVYPMAYDDGTTEHFVKLRRPVFRPLKRAENYEGHFDIRIAGYLLGRI